MAEKKQEEKEEGAPAWMMTYGDMVTLILTFFVLLVSVMVVDPKKFVEVLGTYKEMTGDGTDRITKDIPETKEDYFMQIIRVAARRSEVLEGGEDVTQEGEATRVFAFEENYVKSMAEAPFFDRYSVLLKRTAKINLDHLARRLNERNSGHIIKIVGHYAKAEENFGSHTQLVEFKEDEATFLMRPFEKVRPGAIGGVGDEDVLIRDWEAISGARSLAFFRAEAVREYLIARGVAPNRLVTMTGGAVTKERVHRAKAADAVTFRPRGGELVADMDAEGNIATEKVDILKNTAEASGMTAERRTVDNQVLRPWQQFIFVDAGGDAGRMVEIVVTGQLVR